jgi:hypothetical protein
MAGRVYVDQVPLQVVCNGYQGDPFSWALDLTVDGHPADMDGWTWQAWIEVAAGLIVPWICTPEAHGVALYLRGADTLRLPAGYCPFDVTGRDPAAGEGWTVARGQIFCLERVTPPLRGMAPGAVEPHPPAVLV